MNEDSFSLITKDDLEEINFESNNKLSEEILLELNHALSVYFLSIGKRQPGLRKKIEKSTKELLNLINDDLKHSLYERRENARLCIEVLDKKIKQLNKKNKEPNKNIKLPEKYFIKATLDSFSPHNEKLKIIDKSLKELNSDYFKKIKSPLEEIKESLLILLQGMYSLNPEILNNKTQIEQSPYINEFNKLEEKRSDLDIEFIQYLHKIYKHYTGKSDKFTYSDYKEQYSGNFFSLLKLCFYKIGKNISDDRISKLIGCAKL